MVLAVNLGMVVLAVLAVLASAEYTLQVAAAGRLLGLVLMVWAHLISAETARRQAPMAV